MPKVTLAVTVLILHLSAGIAVADSDGYYCLGRGYLAYQFGFAAPSARPHRLYVIRIDETAPRIPPPVIFDLPQFQVHGIACGERSIKLAAFDAIHTVTLDETRRPIAHDSSPWTDDTRRSKEFFTVTPNLAAWRRTVGKLSAERTPLGAARGGGKYYLEIRGSEVKEKKCTSLVVSRVVRTDRSGREVERAERRAPAFALRATAGKPSPERRAR